MGLQHRIREARGALGISQEELARRTGVSLNAVNRLERGVATDPHYSTLLNLARALDVNPHWLYTGEELQEPVTDPLVLERLRASLRRLGAEDRAKLRELTHTAFSVVRGRGAWVGGETGVRTLQELKVFEREHDVSTGDVVQALEEALANGELELVERQTLKAIEARKADLELGAVGDEETA